MKCRLNERGSEIFQKISTSISATTKKKGKTDSMSSSTKGTNLKSTELNFFAQVQCELRQDTWAGLDIVQIADWLNSTLTGSYLLMARIEDRFRRKPHIFSIEFNVPDPQ